MYNGLGRWPASSSCSRVGIDIGGSGIDCGMGDGGAGGAGFGLSVWTCVAILPATAAWLLRPSSSSGAGRWAGWTELRRECWWVVGWLVGWLVEDLRLPMGGVDNVRPLRTGRPGVELVFGPSSLRPGRSRSRCVGSSVARDRRRLASTTPAVNGGSAMGRSGMAATGRDSGAAVNSCILQAERRRTRSGLLVLVLDRLLDEVGKALGGIGSAEGGSRNGSPSLWLSLEGSGVGTPEVGLETVRSRGGRGCGSAAVSGGGGGSLGVRTGDGRWLLVRCEPLRLLGRRFSLLAPLPGVAAMAVATGALGASEVLAEDGASAPRPVLSMGGLGGGGSARL